MRRPLTDKQHRVYVLRYKHHLSLREIARREKCSKQAITTILRRIASSMKQEKTVFPPAKGGSGRGEGEDSSGFSLKAHPVRLHGVSYLFRLHDVGEFYRRLYAREKKSFLVRGHRVVLYRRQVVVYFLGSWYGGSAAECDRAFMTEFSLFVRDFQRECHVSIAKRNATFYRRIKAHYADVNNGLAREVQERGEKIRVTSPLDGKEWLTFDDSLRLGEAETTHTPSLADPSSSRDDMDEVIRPFFNDLRLNKGKVYLPSEQSAFIKVLVEDKLLEIQRKNLEREAEAAARRAQEEFGRGRPDYVG